jgi:predicted Zn-dependent peptidase
MKFLRFLCVLLLAAVLPTVVSGQNLEDKVTEFELRNGMKFVVVERHVAPVFFAAVLFRVGSVNEWDGVTGISHLLEHMMFKGTKTVGTKSYAREKRYFKQEDEVAAAIDDLRLRIGQWRLKILNDFSRDLISSLDERTKQDTGGDKAKELSVLIAELESGDRLPAEADQYPTLVAEGDVDYLDLYTMLKRRELELENLMVAHRDLIIKDELWETYLQNGARMLNAFTSNDITGYIVYLPANRLELWMMLESDRMENAVFREFYSERDVVAEERRLHENDPESVLIDALLAAAFQASPYGRPVLGWMSDIQTMTREELAAYYQRFYGPNNAVVLLVGDLDVDDVKRMAGRYFGGIPGQESPDPLNIIEPEQQGERRVEVEFDAEPQVMIAYHVPVAPHPDSYAISVLRSILGQGRTSRLYKKIYEELELTSSAPAVSFEPGQRLPNLLLIHAYPRHPHTTEEVEEAIYAEIEALKSEPPTEREIQKIRNVIDANMVRMLGSNLGIAFNIGMTIAIRDNWRAFLDDIERTKQVEAADVSSVAGKYLVPGNRTVATLVKTDEPAEEVAEGERVDFRALMRWVRSLPEEEQKEIFQRVQTMNDTEREVYARQLMERMKAESETESEAESEGKEGGDE